jgi:hypothetical protein
MSRWSYVKPEMVSDTIYAELLKAGEKLCEHGVSAKF